MSDRNQEVDEYVDAWGAEGAAVVGGVAAMDFVKQGHEPWEVGHKYDSDKMYRVLGQDGLDAAKREGKFNPKPGGKWADASKPETYYNKGFAVKYSDDPRAPFVEVPKDDRFVKFKNKKGGYHATVGEDAVSMRDRGVKIHQPLEGGGTKVLYDNATPWKYHGRNVIDGAKQGVAGAVPFAAAGAVSNAVKRAATGRTGDAPLKDLAQDFASEMTLGVSPGAGNLPPDLTYSETQAKGQAFADRIARRSAERDEFSREWESDK